jgi:hypothetical protein
MDVDVDKEALFNEIYILNIFPISSRYPVYME